MTFSAETTENGAAEVTASLSNGISVKKNLDRILLLEESINHELAEFDPVALLRLLHFEGVDLNQIHFSSFNSLSSQSKLIELIKIDWPKVSISINLGFLSATGILPSHMREFIDRLDVDQDYMATFLGFYYHLLILNYLLQAYPEINSLYFPDWAATKVSYVHLQNMRSTSTLHWLFQVVFPELEVSIESGDTVKREIRSQFFLGKSTLNMNPPIGGIALNKNKIVIIHLRNRETVLAFWQKTLENALTYTQKKLNTLILPWLRGTGLDIDIYLHLDNSVPIHNLRLTPNSILGNGTFNTEHITLPNTTSSSKKTLRHCITLHKGPISCEPTIQEAQHYNAIIDWEAPCRIQL